MTGTAIVKPTTTEMGPSIAIEELVDRAQAYASADRTAKTRREYERDFLRFQTWCRSHGRADLPAAPDTVGLYLTYLAQSGKATATIDRALASISVIHTLAKMPLDRKHPEIYRVLTGIHRTLGTAPVHQKAPIEGNMLRQFVGTIGSTKPLELRNRALILVGFFGALRRSELVALDLADVSFSDAGIRLTIRRSKTDQEGEGAELGLPYAGDPSLCPVRALKAYMAAVPLDVAPGDETGRCALFRDLRSGRVRGRLSDDAVVQLVKTCAKKAGLDPSAFAGHSLRSGFATTAALHGKGLDQIMRQTRHKSEKVARRYIRHATVFHNNPAAGMF